jgi:hypothetical protein
LNFEKRVSALERFLAPLESKRPDEGMTRSQSREQSENNRNNITQVKQEMKDEIFNAMSKVGMVLPFYSPV